MSIRILKSLKAAIRDDDPVVFFESKRCYRNYREPVGETVVPLGKARVDREGEDCTIVTYGFGVHLARQAADALAADGVRCHVLDVRTLVPLDKEAIAAAVQRTGRLLIVHEANRTMGFGAEIAAFAAEELFLDLDVPILRVAADDCHLPYNGPEEQAILPGPQDVIAAARRLASY